MRLFPSAPFFALALTVVAALSACSGDGGDAPPGDAPLADKAARSADGFITVESGYFYAPPEGETLAAVSVSETLGCGLREDGSLVCWPDFGDFERIWGDYVDDLPRAAPPPEGAFTAVSVGESQACALREDGSPACWALLEAPEDVDAAPPGWDSGTTGRPPEGERFASVSVGEWQACGLRLDGSPVCWPLDDSIAAQRRRPLPTRRSPQ